jgi:lysyl-tRNA synthetase class 2
MGKENVTLDEGFFKALENGMPPSGGIALGVERLFMALTNVEKISDLRLFPLK